MWCGAKKGQTHKLMYREAGVCCCTLILTSSPETQWVYRIHLNRAAGLWYTDFGEGQVGQSWWEVSTGEQSLVVSFGECLLHKSSNTCRGIKALAISLSLMQRKQYCSYESEVVGPSCGCGHVNNTYLQRTSPTLHTTHSNLLSRVTILEF